MDFWSTKTDSEREQEEVERLVRPNPSSKPPRRDLRRERISPEVDKDTDDVSAQRDRSRNYKTMAARSLIERAKCAGKDRIPAKSRETGETVMISPDTLKDEPGKYEVLKDDEAESAEVAPAIEENKDESRAEKRRKRLQELDQKEKPADQTPKTEKAKEPDGPKTGESAPKEETEKQKYYRGIGDALSDLAEDDPKLKGSLKNYVKDPENQLKSIAKDNPDFPVAKFFPGVKLPKGLNTVGDLDEALKNATPKGKGKPKGKGPTEGEKPAEKGSEGPKEGDEPQDGEEPTEKTEPTEAEKAGIAPPKRRPFNSAEREEALSLLVDTFPPEISSELISKHMHPDDVRSLVQTYHAAQKVDPKSMDDVIFKAASFYQPDPDQVPPPTAGKNAAGQLVSFDDLTPEEQSESTRQHQVQIAAMSLAAKVMLTKKFEGKGGLTGKSRIPKPLASTLAGLVLTKASPDQSNEIAARVFDTVIEQGDVANISDRSARSLLYQLKDHPAAKAAATAYMQANDYGLAKDKFLKGDDDTLSEWQDPREILKGLRKASNFFDQRSTLYGEEGSPHPASTFFRSRVMTRLRALDPKKARMVSAALPALEEQEYKEHHRKWEAKHREWTSKNVAHEKAVQEYTEDPSQKKPPGEFNEPEPVEPKAPATQPKSGEDVWNWDTFNAKAPAKVPPLVDKPTDGPEAGPPASVKTESGEVPVDAQERKEIAQSAEKMVKNPPKLNEEESPEKSSEELPVDDRESSEIDQLAEKMVKNPPKLNDKQADDFTYSAAPVMGSASKSAVYHGIDPYAYGPAAYPGWLQPHQRDLGEADFKLILGMAGDWLKSPMLSVAVDGMVPDARYRAALDLAIYDSPYNRAINAVQYNQLLAKLAGVPEPGKGETLLTIRASHNFKTETRYLVVSGSTPISREVLAAVEAQEFPYMDEDGKTRKGGQIAARVTRTVSASEIPSTGQVAETVLRIDFPQGSESAALRGVQAAFTPLQLTVEKTTPGYLPQFRASSFSPPPSVPTEGSPSMKASTEIRKFAAEVAKTNSKLAFEMLSTADRLAEEEKKPMPPWLKEKIDDKKDEDKGQQKEAGVKLGSLRTLIIKQAAGVDASQRGPWLPILQALKDLG